MSLVSHVWSVYAPWPPRGRAGRCRQKRPTQVSDSSLLKTTDISYHHQNMNHRNWIRLISKGHFTSQGTRYKQFSCCYLLNEQVTGSYLIWHLLLLLMVAILQTIDCSCVYIHVDWDSVISLSLCWGSVLFLTIPDTERPPRPGRWADIVLTAGITCKKILSWFKRIILHTSCFMPLTTINNIEITSS